MQALTTAAHHPKQRSPNISHRLPKATQEMLLDPIFCFFLPPLFVLLSLSVFSEAHYVAQTNLKHVILLPQPAGNTGV